MSPVCTMVFGDQLNGFSRSQFDGFIFGDVTMDSPSGIHPIARTWADFWWIFIDRSFLSPLIWISRSNDTGSYCSTWVTSEGKVKDTSTIARLTEKNMFYRMYISPVSVVHSICSKIMLKISSDISLDWSIGWAIQFHTDRPILISFF